MYVDIIDSALFLIGLLNANCCYLAEIENKGDQNKSGKNCVKNRYCAILLFFIGLSSNKLNIFLQFCRFSLDKVVKTNFSML